MPGNLIKSSPEPPAGSKPAGGLNHWQKMAGTGSRYDSFYPGVGIGSNGALFYGGYGGYKLIRDSR